MSNDSKRVKNDNDVVIVATNDSKGLLSNDSKSLNTFGIERRKVTVQVPATSANVGSGYDCIGFALDLWNELTVERSDKFEITAEGEGADELPLNETNIACVAVGKAFKAAGKEVPPLKYHLKQRIPHARGLGSSSAGIIAGLLAGLVLSGKVLDVKNREELLQLATEIEHHPDNVAPAAYGGLQMGIYSQRLGRWCTERIPLPPGLVFVAFIPETKGYTEELRKVVPKQLSVEDTIFNMSRFGWLIHALITNKLENLRDGLEDHIHQNQRSLVESHRHVRPMIDAAYNAGAIGAYLSGSGPVVMAITQGGYGDFFTQNPHERSDALVARAMQDVANDPKINVKGKVYVTHPSQTGGVVVQADPPFSSELLSFNGNT